GGDLNATLPFNTSPLKNDDGSVATGVRMAMTVNKPDASTVNFKQLTDADGRIRGQIYGSVIDQTGTYTIQVQVDGGGPSGSANFPIREHAQLDRDNQVFTGNNQTFRNDTDSATAFRVQDASGTDVLNVDTLTNTVTVANLTVTGTCTGCATGSLQNAYDNGNTITTTDARDIDITLADTATDANFTVDIATGSTGRFAVQAAGTDTFSVGATGAALFRNSTNSTTAFQVQQADGSAVLLVDTQNASVKFQDASGGEIMEVSNGTGVQVKTTANNAWTNLGTDGSADILQLYDSGGSTVTKVSASGVATFTTPADGFHVRSDDAGTRSSIQIGRTSSEALLGVPGAGGQYSSDANAGDFVLRTNSASAQLILQNGTGAGNIIIDNGNTTIKPTTDSATAFQVQSTGGTTLLGVDTVSGEIFSTVASGGDAFVLNTANTFFSGNLLVVQNNGTDQFVISPSGIITTASVNAGSIVDGSITSADIANGAATPAKTASITSTAAADPMPAPTTVMVRVDAGVATINDIGAGAGGQVVVYRFNTTVTVKDGTGNLRLAGDFAADSQDTLTLVYDSTAGFWTEMSRSSN
ncbi:MAG: hypothetical protein WD846_04465, partial [Patescibacteria group bacterium]